MHAIARTSELPPGSGICAEVHGRRIAVFNVDGRYFAIDDECPHSGAPLSEGDLEGCTVVCPWHSATFDLADGRVLTPPAEEGVAVYRVEVQDGEIRVELP